MIVKPINKEAYNLLHEGVLAFIEMERSGIRIDVGLCRSLVKKLDRKLAHLKDKIEKSKEGKLWTKVYGGKTNFDSPQQLSNILFNKLNLVPTKQTDKGNLSTDAESLISFKLGFTDDLISLKRTRKTRNTYLMNILREQVGGILRPSFNLNTAISYRSSCSNINLQNIAFHIEEIARYVRPVFIPREGHRLGGWDYSGIEVCISTCYHQDPNMIKYIKDPTTDMHRDTAMDLFMLDQDEITKLIRFIAKNKFVFAEFYGDYYVSITEAMWKEIDKLNVKLKDGTPLKEHLRDQGIGTYKAFESHMKDVEDKFWNERFPIYAEWKDEIVARYEVDGYIDSLSGFRYQGYMKRNELCNYPIQGTAFHCLLWSLPRLIKWMKGERLQSMIVGQIHDEITGDIHEDELDLVSSMAHQIMCVDIKKHWDWIKVPLSIEGEFSGVNEDWSKKKEIKINPLTWKEDF